MTTKTTSRAQAISAIALACVIALGVAALAIDGVTAGPKKPKEPLCGPDILWLCTFKDGSTELVGATRCEIAKFEKKNKATCVPATF